MKPSAPPVPGKTPRRSKPSLAARLRKFWFVAVLAVLATGVALKLAVRLPAFAAGVPSVTASTHVSRGEILARAAVDPNADVWLLDARAVERRVEAIPYVASARFSRGLPGGSSIAVTERTPDACVRSETSFATIDAEQRVLHTGCSEPIVYVSHALTEYRPGAFLHDATLARLQSDARTLDARGRHLTDLGLDDFGELEATLPDGIRVRFGDDGDLSSKERLIEPILAALGPRTGTVSAIDLRAPSTPVVEHRHAAEKAIRTLSTAN